MDRNAQVKGRIAESLMECMFNELGYKVIRYGYENIMPELANINCDLKGRIAKKIRHHPDFIVVDQRNVAYFIEVKFRANGEFEFDEDSSYPDAFILMVTRQGLYILSFEKLCHDKDPPICLPHRMSSIQES